MKAIMRGSECIGMQAETPFERAAMAGPGNTMTGPTTLEQRVGELEERLAHLEQALSKAFGAVREAPPEAVR